MNEMVEEFLEDGRDRMDKAVVACHNEFNTIRTGRASTALLDRIVRRLLRQQDTSETARQHQRPRTAAAGHHSLRQISHEGDRARASWSRSWA